MTLGQFVKNAARAEGFDLVGTSRLAPSAYRREVKRWVREGRHGNMEWYVKNIDRRVDPTRHLFQHAVSAVTVGLYYRPADISDELKNDPSRGIIARYAQYDDYHKTILGMLERLAARIDREIQGRWRYQVYVDTGPVLEREVGQKGNLGFIGKNTTLINTTLGSYFFLGEIICDLDLQPDEESLRKTAGTCGLCTRCGRACPTAAIVSPYRLDANLCISYLTIEFKGSIPEKLRPFMKNRIYGCDICQEVCPWNKRVPAGVRARLSQRPDLIAPKLLELVQLNEQDFVEKFRGTPVVRATWAGFIRNVLIAVGNWGSSEALLSVRPLCRHKHAVVRESAQWACRQIT